MLRRIPEALRGRRAFHPVSAPPAELFFVWKYMLFVVKLQAFDRMVTLIFV